MARAIGIKTVAKKINSSLYGSSSCCIASDKAEIEKLAYKFFLERGGVHGYHQEDWLKAEAIVKGRKKD